MASSRQHESHAVLTAAQLSRVSLDVHTTLHRMLNENDVVAAVCEHLRVRGWKITRTASTIQTGVDIVATKRGRTVLVEAKGETTSKKSTARFGKAFTRAQCKTHLAVALLTAARLRDAKRMDTKQSIAIALPDVAPNPELVRLIGRSLRDLDIGMLWVSPLGGVRLDAKWKL